MLTKIKSHLINIKVSLTGVCVDVHYCNYSKYL